MEASVFQTELDYSVLHFDRQLDQEVANLLRSGDHSLIVVESMTGGMLSERITRQTGSSEYFLGGVIAYSPLLKVQLSGVSPATLRQYGAVSQEVALEMVRGGKKWAKSTCGVSVTGFAGPSGLENSSVGLVFVGVVVNGKEKVTRFMLSGNRQSIRSQAVQAALVLLRQLLRVGKD